MLRTVHAGLWQPQALAGADQKTGEPQWVPAPGEPVFVRWRDLTWKEYQQFTGARRIPAVLYSEIYEKVLVEGPSLALVPAGIVEWIGRQQFDQNPFSWKYPPIRASIDQSRAKVQSSWLTIARAVVASVFHYSFEEIDEWPSELFFERVAQAELLTGSPLEPSDPKAPKPPDRKSVV